MVKKIIKALIAVAIILPLVGGTCGPPCPVGACGRPQQGAPGVQGNANIVRITNRPSHDCTPVISPCGKMVAFESWEPSNYYNVPTRNRLAGNFDIYIVSSQGGGGYQRVSNNPADDYYPAWFPEGDRILFTSERMGYPRLWAKHFNGMNGVQSLSWDGKSNFGGDVGEKHMVFTATDYIYSDITSLFCNMSRPHLKPKQAGQNPYPNMNPAWLSRWHPRIYRADRNGARLTDLGLGMDPKLSPDGKWIVFSSVETGNWDIWIMDINGNFRTQITSYPGNEMTPCWSPDGKWVAYSKSAPQAIAGAGLIDDEYWNIWVTHVQTGETVQKTFSRWFRDLSPSWGYVYEGDFYRDYIFFHSDRDNWEYTGFDIYRLDPDMGIEKYDIPDKPAGKAIKYPTKENPVVRVLNGTRKTDDEVPKWAARVTEKLRGLGYNCLDPMNTYVEVPNYVKVYYRAGYKEVAAKMAAEIPDIPNIDPVLKQMPSNFRWNEEDVIVVLGK